MKSFEGYNAREQQLVQFNKWADHEGLDLKMSGEFEHSNKETHMAYNGFKAGQQYKQAEVDELQKRIDDALNVIYKEKSAVECDKYKGIDSDLIIGIGYDLHKILKGDQS